MTEGVVFFSRCRPEGSDPIELVRSVGHVFIGWPAWRPGVVPRRGHLRDAVIDLRCSDNDWATYYARFKKDERRQYQKNRNFVRKITAGAIALVPRPNLGVVYAGRVVAPFSLLDDPSWGGEYLRLRYDQNLEVDDTKSLADVAQCWQVDRFREIPFTLIPAWIRKSLFGRSTYDIIHPLKTLDLDPYPLLDRLIDNPERPDQSWTVDPTQVKLRMVNAIGPNTFEHLCVALLQLENPEQVWVHVGGSGDGGVDGIGSDANGELVGLLQCKWTYSGEPVFGANSARCRKVLACLIHENERPPEGIEFWSRADVVSRVIKDANRLPLALSLRVGRPSVSD